jgi:hypothetical protein
MMSGLFHVQLTLPTPQQEIGHDENDRKQRPANWHAYGYRAMAH